MNYTIPRTASLTHPLPVSTCLTSCTLHTYNYILKPSLTLPQRRLSLPPDSFDIDPAPLYYRSVLPGIISEYIHQVGDLIDNYLLLWTQGSNQRHTKDLLCFLQVSGLWLHFHPCHLWSSTSNILALHH